MEFSQGRTIQFSQMEKQITMEIMSIEKEVKFKNMSYQEQQEEQEVEGAGSGSWK